jgi:hypothetical protein
MHRGLERRRIFDEPYDRSVFLRLLGECAGVERNEATRYRSHVQELARSGAEESP